MNFDFIKHKESENIIPIILEGKENYYLDLLNIEHSWTGRVDALFSNIFMQEAVQLIVNAISLYEKGYFDCAFYSLRQSLEISTTSIYFVDDSKISRNEKFKKWKGQERFPMQNQMLDELMKRESDFNEIKTKMPTFFEDIESTKQLVNKYVHKQGFGKFYVCRNNPLEKFEIEDNLVSDFKESLEKSISAVAVFRLVVDPFPILLADESIYNRTGEMMTEGYNEEFIAKYIGEKNTEDYKQTNIYQNHYSTFINNEEMLPSIVNIIKDQYIDKTKIDEIMSQKHLLSYYDFVAVTLVTYSDKIAKIYGGSFFRWYFSNIQSKRSKMSWSSVDFDNVINGDIKYNVIYDEVFLTHIKVLESDFLIEHNEIFDENEIMEINRICIIKD